MPQATDDWATILADNIRKLIANPANFSAQQGLQAMLAQMMRRVNDLEAKVALLEQGKKP